MTPSTNSHSGETTIVVVPCYNEAQRLDLPAYHAFLASCRDIALLFVDDGSTDDTPLVLEQLRRRHPQQVCTMRLAINAGKGEAVRRGMQLAFRRRATIAGYWDADLATPLATIADFRRLLHARPDLRLVMGSRVALLGRCIQRCWRRHLLGRAFATAASHVLGLPVYDTQCGAKLFRVSPETAALFREPFSTRWIFDVEILSRIAGSKASHAPQAPNAIYEYPLEQWREVGSSRLKASDFAVAAIDLARIYWRSRTSRSVPQIISEPPKHGASYREAA
jgi:glycosyltransferase involved in cell wall biosynthesis